MNNKLQFNNLTPICLKRNISQKEVEKKITTLNYFVFMRRYRIENNKRFVRQLFPLFNTYACMCVQ